MKTLDPGYRAHIESGATTLCTCWRIERADGAVLGFTDHDMPVAFGGTVFHPAHGLDGAEATARLGAQVDTGEVLGVLSAEAIAEDDIALGRFDGAVVETWRVNWNNPGERDLTRRDTIGEITREDGLFRAELRSPAQALNRRQGRIYQPLCDARLGDTRCGVDLEAARYRFAASVAAVRDPFHIEVPATGAPEPGWLALGHALWQTGKRAGLRDAVAGHMREGGVDIVAFRARVGDWAAPGDALVLHAGCDRRLETCAAKFANVPNFRGFPHIPGNDYLLRHPRSGAVRDGRPVVG